MKKIWLILGALIIVVLLLVFLYVLLFGTPRSMDDVWGSLGPSGDDQSGIVILPEPEVEELTGVNRPRLRQLTFRPVAGFVELYNSETETVTIRYMEAGDGHIFDLNIMTDEDSRVSNTTISEASRASFSPSGNTVAVRSKNYRRSSPLLIGSVAPTQAQLTTYEIEAEVFDFKIVSDDELLFTKRLAEGLTAFNHDLDNQSEETLFTVPFFEANLSWGTSSTDTHYVYNKPAHLLEGYLYSFTQGNLKREPISGFGLAAFQTPDYLFYSHTRDSKPVNTIFNRVTMESETMPALLLPEKCAVSHSNPSTIWCGFELDRVPFDFPDSWYQGALSFKDTIWRIEADTLSMILEVDTFAEVAREIDVTDMYVGPSETALYFINKNDRTLWIYEL